MARCVASEALPPLPQTSSLWPEVRHRTTKPTARLSGFSSAAQRASGGD